MNRNDILDRIVYSHVIEKMQGTLLCRIDRMLTILLISAGSAVFANFSNSALFGALVMILSGVQFVYRFGVMGSKALTQSKEYQALYTNSSNHSEDELLNKLSEMERSDSNVWTVLDSPARKRTRIMRGIQDDTVITLSPIQKMTSWLAGDFPT